MITYPKIETPFKRDEFGTKRLLEGVYRSPEVEYLKDLPWICTEKVDGTNIGIVWDGHKVSFQGRTERAQIPAHLVNKLNELFGGYVNEEIFEQHFGENKVILFGEGYGPKIQKGGGNYRDDVSFILFDVYFPESNLWLMRESVENIATLFNIDVVPIILVGPLSEAIKYVKNKPKSVIGKQVANMEGLVCRPSLDLLNRRGQRIIVKIKVNDFV